MKLDLRHKRTIGRGVSLSVCVLDGVDTKRQQGSVLCPLCFSCLGSLSYVFCYVVKGEFKVEVIMA